QFGGVVAAPIVGDIINDSLPLLGVERRTDGLDKDYTWPESPKVDVPDLVGTRKKEVLERYETFSLDIHGEGDTIVDQSPKPGMKVEEGSTIRVYLSNKIDRDSD